MIDWNTIPITDQPLDMESARALSRDIHARLIDQINAAYGLDLDADVTRLYTAPFDDRVFLGTADGPSHLLCEDRAVAVWADTANRLQYGYLLRMGGLA